MTNAGESPSSETATINQAAFSIEIGKARGAQVVLYVQDISSCQE